MQLRSLASLALVTLVSIPFNGCGGDSGGGGGGGGGGTVTPVLLEDGAACAGAAKATSGSDCAGGTCIALLANDQNEAGICSARCTATCGTGELCVSGFPDGNNYCLRSCTSDAGCLDGFSCVTDTGSGASFCWVTQNGGGTPPGHADCTGCDLLNDVPGYCGSVAGTTQVCDCPNGSPSTACTAAAGAANTWCCP
jgi:hypothetical protein